MYITSVHRIPSRIAKTEGYNENYCPGGWFGKGPSLGHIEMIFHYELKISVATHAAHSRNKQTKQKRNEVLISIPFVLTNIYCRGIKCQELYLVLEIQK